MDLLDIMESRQSIRNYSGQKIDSINLEKILKAGLSSATGRGKRPWHFFVVQNTEYLKKLSMVRNTSSKMLEKAGAAIIVCADNNLSDTWIEDCSICMANMHLMAHYLGYGSCWIQIRNRESFIPKKSSEEYIKEFISIPDNFSIEAILSIGSLNQTVKNSSNKNFKDLFLQKITNI